MTEGIRKRLFGHRGFGFIKAEDGREVFFHRTALRNIRFDFLKEGDPVNFDIVKASWGAMTINIEVKEEKG
ncbi:Cold shock protein CspC [subsurface metagenome]